jgi:tetratricopeptide (TPR) repeat protein
MEAANRAVELARQSASAHVALVTAYWLTCQPDRIRVEAEAITAINPNDAGALGLIGTSLIYAGDLENGRRFAEKAIELAGPASPSFWWSAIGDYHYSKGEYAEALELFRKDYTESNWVDHMSSLLSFRIWGASRRLGLKSPQR